jgi:hypothetical protein
MPKPRGGTSYRLSDDAQVLLGVLASRLGLTKTSVLEMAIRKLAFAEFGDSAMPTKPQPGPVKRVTGELLAQKHEN